MPRRVRDNEREGGKGGREMGGKLTIGNWTHLLKEHPVPLPAHWALSSSTLAKLIQLSESRAKLINWVNALPLPLPRPPLLQFIASTPTHTHPHIFAYIMNAAAAISLSINSCMRTCAHRHKKCSLTIHSLIDTCVYRFMFLRQGQID